MKTFAVFFTTGLVSGKLVEACGDRSVVRLDGRQSRLCHELIAEEECRSRGFAGWRLVKGDSLLRSRTITPIVSLFY